MVKIDNLTGEITKQLEIYTEEVQKKVIRAENKVSREAVKELQATSPVGETGRYAEGWTRKRTPEGIIIYNKDRYQIAHLLEHGHVKRGGGRVRAIPHIRRVEEATTSEFEKLVEKAIKL